MKILNFNLINLIIMRTIEANALVRKDSPNSFAVIEVEPNGTPRITNDHYPYLQAPGITRNDLIRAYRGYPDVQKLLMEYKTITLTVTINDDNDVVDNDEEAREEIKREVNSRRRDRRPIELLEPLLGTEGKEEEPQKDPNQ